LLPVGPGVWPWVKERRWRKESGNREGETQQAPKGTRPPWKRTFPERNRPKGRKEKMLGPGEGIKGKTKGLQKIKRLGGGIKKKKGGFSTPPPTVKGDDQAPGKSIIHMSPRPGRGEKKDERDKKKRPRLNTLKKGKRNRKQGNKGRTYNHKTGL